MADPVSGVGSSGITFDQISSPLISALTTAEGQINGLLSTVGNNASTADLLNLQVSIQKWTMIGTIQSTVVKDLSDSLKGIISKAS